MSENYSYLSFFVESFQAEHDLFSSVNRTYVVSRLLTYYTIL